MSASLVGSEMCIRDRYLGCTRLELASLWGSIENKAAVAHARWRCLCALDICDGTSGLQPA
eukprot:8303604-Alexandrium_andersonii.AAC.1